jgi:Tfp pilus assembly protein PilX
MQVKQKNQRMKLDQRGLVSIVVTVFVMVILSLVVLAFSQVSRREQRQALDRQLSTQAFYAAEAGINDTVNKIQSKDPSIGLEKTRCDDQAVSNENKLDAADGVVSYSCVLYDTAPTTVEYGSLNKESGEVLSLKTSSNNLSKLSVSWNDTNNGSNFSGCAIKADKNKFPKSVNYTNCDAGMIRLVFMPIAGLDRESLYNSTFTVYLRPVSDGNATENTIAFVPHSSGADTQGLVIPAHCTAGKCNATITNLPGGSALFLQMKSIYKANTVTLSGTDVANASLRFDQAQAKIDVTGKASDVLRRLQVRVPIYDRQEVPVYAIETMNSMCKRLGVLPNGVVDNDCASGEEYFQ